MTTVAIRTPEEALAAVRRLHPRIGRGKWTVNYIPDPDRPENNFYEIVHRYRKGSRRAWNVDEQTGQVIDW